MRNIGIVVADEGEFSPLIEKIKNKEKCNFFNREGYTAVINNCRVYIFLCGIGKVNAAACTMYLKSLGCEIVLNYGYSGGISGVKKGDVVVSDRFLEHDFDLVCLGYKPCEKPAQEYIYSADRLLTDILCRLCPQAKVGLAVSGDRFVSDDALRCTLKNDFGAMSCDMETAAIASVCHQTGMRFACLRQISDDAGDDASSSYKSEANSGNIIPADVIISLIENLD